MNYNGEGLRVEKEVKGVVTKYLYEKDKVILEVDGEGFEKARNVYGSNLIERKVEGESLKYLYNGHGDVTALVDELGSIKGEYYYDAFGNIEEKPEEEIDNPYRYAGYQYDEESEHYYLNARYYDPKIARFITEDTFRGSINDPLSLNVYTYCHNDPIMYTDPTGHWEERDSKRSSEAQEIIRDLTEDWEKAYANNDKKGMENANKTAIWVRELDDKGILDYEMFLDPKTGKKYDNITYNERKMVTGTKDSNRVNVKLDIDEEMFTDSLNVNLHKTSKKNTKGTGKYTNDYLVQPVTDWGIFDENEYEQPIKSGRITSLYGKRKLNGKEEFHTGVDIGVKQGTEIYAIEDGVLTIRINKPKKNDKSEITIPGNKNGLGYYQYLDFGKNNEDRAVYAHLIDKLPDNIIEKLNEVNNKASNIESVYKKFNSYSVEVKKGELIGYTGNSGRSYGAHLHLILQLKEAEDRQKSGGWTKKNSVDPILYIDLNLPVDNKKKEEYNERYSNLK